MRALKPIRLFVSRAIVAAALALGGCGPLSTAACERASLLCPKVDDAACDATLDLVPPRIRSALVECTTGARTCNEATACFTRNQLYLPTVH